MDGDIGQLDRHRPWFVPGRRVARSVQGGMKTMALSVFDYLNLLEIGYCCWLSLVGTQFWLCQSAPEPS